MRTFLTSSLPNLNEVVVPFNSGISGQKLTTQALPNFVPWIATPYYNASARLWINSLEEGTNDIHDLGVSAATLEAAYVSWAQNVFALGPNTRFVMVIPWPRCDIAGNPTQLATYSAVVAWVRANWNVPQAQGGIGANALADFSADPTIGQPGGFTSNPPSCSLTYSFDQIHPNDTSTAIMASIYTAAVNTLLP